jgi:hypothetical protein
LVDHGALAGTVGHHESRLAAAAASQGKPLLRLASTACPGGIALHLAAPSAATARIPPRHGAVGGAGARGMALRIGDIADTGQPLDCPWRRRKQPQRKPPPHYRRRHIAGRCRLPYREEGAVLNLPTPTPHRSPRHRSPSNAFDQQPSSAPRRMVTPARRSIDERTTVGGRIIRETSHTTAAGLARRAQTEFDTSVRCRLPRKASGLC